MKIALAQINPTVGDIEGNSRKIEDGIRHARERGADLVVFPELSVVGYPPKDLLLKDRFIRDNREAVQRIAEQCRDIHALVGFAASNEAPSGRSLFNSAALCGDGTVLRVLHKSLLPTYDVFDELRYFEPGTESGLIQLPRRGGGAWRIGVTICEDMWNNADVVVRPLYAVDPVARIANDGADMLINLSASPFSKDKQPFRERLFGSHAAKNRLPLLFVNQAGGNDELVFDGASMALDPSGRVVARAKPFEEDLLLVDMTDLGSGRVEDYPATVASIEQALIVGTRDYVGKCRFNEVVLGLSGGIDSAVTAAIAVRALGRDKVHGVAMPSRFSSDHSIADARKLAENLGIDFRIIEIQPVHAAYEAQLAPHFHGRQADVTEENIQARVRGHLLMALSNKFGWMVLTTGNKSELAVGYCTLYGDMCGGLAVISDVPKTLVYRLAEHINRHGGREIIPAGTIAKPPSAELRLNQCDQDSLPPYEVLDRILELYVEQEKSIDEIAAQGLDKALVKEIARKVDVNEYKRKQAAPGLKVTSRAFGFGRRMPIAARFRW